MATKGSTKVSICTEMYSFFKNPGRHQKNSMVSKNFFGGRRRVRKRAEKVLSTSSDSFSQNSRSPKGF